MNSIFGTLLRVKKKIKELIAVSIISAISILGLSYLLMNKSLGLLGIGYAWIIGQGMITAALFLKDLAIRK